MKDIIVVGTGFSGAGVLLSLGAIIWTNAFYAHLTCSRRSRITWRIKLIDEIETE